MEVTELAGTFITGSMPIGYSQQAATPLPILAGTCQNDLSKMEGAIAQLSALLSTLCARMEKVERLHGCSMDSSDELEGAEGASTLCPTHALDANGFYDREKEYEAWGQLNVPQANVHGRIPGEALRTSWLDEGFQLENKNTVYVLMAERQASPSSATAPSTPRLGMFEVSEAAQNVSGDILRQPPGGDS